MAKKKDSVALFEVISKTRENRSEADLGVPAWMGKAGPAGEAPGRREPAEAGLVEAGLSPRRPAVSTVDGRLNLSLNYVSCLAVVLALIVLLGAAFYLGRRVGPGRNAGEAARAGVGGQAGSGEAAQGKPPTPPAVKPQRVAGLYYLIIQGTQGMADRHKADAEKIQQYLQREGVAADVGTFRGNPKQYVVWSLEGFDSPDSEGALAYIGLVEELGRRYRVGGGRYDFKQGRDADGRMKAWFVRFSQP